MKIKAVGFDIDGTLYPDASMYLYSVFAFMHHPRLFYHFGKVRKDIRNIQYTGDFRRIQAEMVAASLHITPERAESLINRHIYSKLEVVFRNVKPYKNVRPVLLSLKRSGIVLGAMSDLPVGRKLDYLNVGDLIDVAFSSEETNYLKPSPVPFKHLVREFNVLPEEILYVGNNYRYDILGASALGMRTAHLSKKEVEDSAADFTFSSFLDLRDWIFSINN